MLSMRRGKFGSVWPAAAGLCAVLVGLAAPAVRAAEGDAAPAAPATEAPAPAPEKKPVNGPALLAKVANQLVVTNPVKSEALLMGGVSSLLIPSGQLQVLSRSPRAVVGKGVTKINTYVFGRTGGVIFEGLAKGHADIQREPAYAGDPLADLPPPDGTGLKSLGDIAAGGKDNMVLSPGVYGAWDLDGEAVVTLKPGRYVLKNGFSQRGRSSLIGDGVLIINEAGPFESKSFGKLALSAPRQGPYTGLVFYQPKTNTQPMTIESAANIAGTIYLPFAQLKSGSVVAVVLGSVVADTVAIEGSNSVRIEGAAFIAPSSPATPRKPAPKKK